jgi:hypothetical protein
MIICDRRAHAQETMRRIAHFEATDYAFPDNPEKILELSSEVRLQSSPARI